MRRWRKRHPEAKRAESQRYRAANLERDRGKKARAQRRRLARKAGLPTDKHTRAEVWERDGGQCQICGTLLNPRNWHEDHIIPISRGGPDTLDNVQATCPFCNVSKGAKVAV